MNGTSQGPKYEDSRERNSTWRLHGGNGNLTEAQRSRDAAGTYKTKVKVILPARGEEEKHGKENQ
jgi:hypothetical protein